MAEIRRLNHEDMIQFYKIHTIVYNMRRKYSDEDTRKAGSLEHPPNWAVGAFDGKKLLAGTFEIDFLMRFDGHSVKMTGIGGVGTLPEARKGGHVRRIFEKILPESYENGVVFSNLAPFSHDFYRKFGYETCSTRKNISISSSEFTDYKPTGQFMHILPGDDTSLLAEVHSAYIENINHAIHRDYWPLNRAWKQFTESDPYSTGTFIYLWKDDNGKARSYIKYKDEMEDGEHNMAVSELAFTDKEGLYGMFGLVSGLSAQFANFKWQMPAFIDPFDFAGDAWAVDIKTIPREMTRVVNVKKALELMRRPGGSGQYVIEVEDENIAANNGKYLVEFENGSSVSQVSSATREPDISCDILSLSQLVTGYRTLEDAMFSRREGVEVHGNLETLKSVFTQRPQHVTEYF